MENKTCSTCRKCFHCLSSLELLVEGRKMTQKDVDYNCELWGGYEYYNFREDKKNEQ